MSLGTHNCPHCGHLSVVEVRAGYYYSCSSCQQVFIEYDAKPARPEEIVKDAETMSPILIGSKGKVNGESFTVTGCISLFQERTTVNLHAITWSYGLPGLIVECDGDYSLISTIDEEPQQNLKDTRLGRTIAIKNFGDAYCYSVDRTRYLSLKGEGKIPFEKLTASLFCFYYSENQKSAFCIFIKEKTTLFTGKFYTFSELNLAPTRSLHDWYK